LVRRGLEPSDPKVAVKRRPQSTAADLNELVKLHALGYSDREISVRIGWSAKWVAEKRKRLSLAPQGVRGRPRKAS
jgi:transposase